MSHQRILLDLKSLANRAKFEEGVLMRNTPEGYLKDAITEIVRLREICTEIDELAYRLEKGFYGEKEVSAPTRKVPKETGRGARPVSGGEGEAPAKERVDSKGDTWGPGYTPEGYCLNCGTHAMATFGCKCKKG